MSNFNGHRNGGIISAGLVAVGLVAVSHVTKLHFSYPEILLCSSVCFGFALFPDLDTKSTPSRYFYAALMIMLAVMYYKSMHQAANIIAFFACIPQITKHRGLLHSKITAIVLPSIPLILYNIGTLQLDIAVALVVAGVIGYYTHLVLDM